MNSWRTAAELVSVPGMPSNIESIGNLGRAGRITRRKRQFGKGWEYLVASLPAEAQAHLRAQGETQPAADHLRDTAQMIPASAPPAAVPMTPPARHLHLAPPPPPREPAAIPLHQPPARPLQASDPEPEPTPDTLPDLAAVEAELAASGVRPARSRARSAPRQTSAVASADLWSWAEGRTAEQRAVGAERAHLVAAVVDLMITEALTRADALARIGAEAGVPPDTLSRWYTEARRYAQADWPAALIPRFGGGRQPTDIHPGAWDWFFNQYMTRGQPTVAEIYRRLAEIAPQHGWDPLPAERTFNRRVNDLPITTRLYHREGKNALAKLIPRQRRDNTVYGPGEAVNGDGLKFDRLWVRWPDGEVLATSTGWFWQDLRTGRLLAHRLAKTENTDLFRLATYDLLGVCLPRAAWMDNTTVAANLAMTAGASGRHRFGHARRAEDPLGLLGQCGIEAHFTDPDQEHASPGSKRIERAFGIGGLHTEVAHSPRLCGHGFRKDDPVDYALWAAIVAEEVARFNARPKRRATECAGIHSYDDLWRDLTARFPVRVAAESQRRLLLLMVERCRTDQASGEFRLKAGSSHLGAARYWAEWMVEVRGQQVDVYFDPADLGKPVTVYAASGLRLGEAQRLADAGHHDTDAAREVRRTRKRQQKNWKKEAQDAARIDALVAAEQYPAAAVAEIPEPGVVSARFGGTKRVDVETGEIIDLVPAGGGAAWLEEQERVFAAAVASLGRGQVAI